MLAGMQNGALSMSSKKSSPKILMALGLTSVLTTGVRCGPCLNILPPDTGDTGDTGEAEDSGETAADAQTPPAADSRQEAAKRVLARGVLPKDVAAILSTKTEQ